MKNTPRNQKIHKLNFLLLLLILGLSFRPCSGQEKDSMKVYKNLKNTIRINLTNPMIFGDKFNVLGYERVISDYQTASIGMGRFSFPTFSIIDRDSIKLSRNVKDKGFNLSLDYRFYLQKENRHKAPRGVYIGPFYAYNYFSRENQWDLNLTSVSTTVDTKTVMNMNSFGFQLGYQFIFWNRVSLDLILVGPALWFFNVKTDVSTSLSAENEQLLFEALNDAIKEKFPNSNVAFDGSGYSKKGSFRTNTFGYRYMFNLGFRF
jgi:hypothetical protein